MKWANLVNMSTATKITLCPSDLGRPSKNPWRDLSTLLQVWVKAIVVPRGVGEYVWHADTQSTV